MPGRGGSGNGLPSLLRFLPRERLVTGALVLLGLAAIGTFGFAITDDIPLFDAFYLTITTLSTVGYGDIVPVTTAARAFSVGLIILGVGAALYTIGTFAEFLIAGRIREILGRRSMKRAIDSISGHIIICGYGRFGRAVSERMIGAQVVVIDQDASVQPECEADGHFFLHGSALDDAVLAAAGLDRALALVAATPSDSDNVFIALSAREANPEISIHSRAETPAGIRRLKLSGATQVISPHQIGGQRIANAILRPGVVEFLELSTPGHGPEIDLEEVVLVAGASVENASLRELPERDVRVSVVAIKRGDEPLRLSPGPTDVLRAGDRVVAVGDRENLRRLAALAGTEEVS